MPLISGDYFQHNADAIVSPANSFGIMNGGLDLTIRYELGFDVEQSLQRKILLSYHGELPVGSALIIKTTSNKKISSLVCSGLGTGIGGVEPMKCAAHMKAAYDAFAKPAKIPSYNIIHSIHKSLKKS